MSATILDVRQAIANKIRKIPEVLEVVEHGGRFSADELDRFALAAPAVVVCALGMDDVEVEGDLPVVNVQWGAFLVTVDTAEYKRDEAALFLMTKLFRVINQNERWGFKTGVHMMKSIRGINLYSGRNTDEKGVGLWAVQWTQGFDVSLIDLEALPPFKMYTSTMSLEGVNPNAPKGVDQVNLQGATVPQGS